jgi:hypothetical protein
MIDRSSAAMGLAIVLAANALYLAGSARVLDPMLTMDPFYIDMARRPLAAIFAQDPSWGPLYAVWLKPFVAVLHDPISVYLANVYAMSIVVSVLLFATVFVASGRTWVAVGAALFFLISDVNVPLDSRVNSFALVPLLSGLIVATLLPPGRARTAACAVAAVVAAYARPELCLAVVAVVLAAAWRGRRRHRAWPAIGLLVLGPTVLWFARSNGRLFLAFQIAFGWNWLQWHHATRDVFSIWQQEFGAAQSVLQASIVNPLAVAHHVADNALGTLAFLAGGAGAHRPLVPAVWGPAARLENVLASMTMLGILVASGARRVWRRRVIDRYGDPLLLSGAVAGASIVAALVVFPSPRYLAIPAVLIILNAALALAALLPVVSPLSRSGRVLAALGCLAAVPRPFALPSDYVGGDAPFQGRIAVARKVTDTLVLIRALHLPSPVSVLTDTDGVGEMLGDGFLEVKLWQKGEEPLEAFMREHDVGMIVNLQGGRESFAAADPYWARIQADPDEGGFTRVTVPEHDRVGVYVRKDLLHPSDAGR